MGDLRSEHRNSSFAYAINAEFPLQGIASGYPMNGHVHDDDDGSVEHWAEPFDDDDDDRSLEYWEPFYLDDATMAMMKKNDPDVKSLEVVFNGDANPNFGFDPLTIDWGADGGAISNNPHLKVLEVNDIDQSRREKTTNARDLRIRGRNAKSFLRAVAANRSIEHFTLKGSMVEGMDVGETFSILSGFIENNSNLCSFDMCYAAFNSRSAHSLATALSQCTAALKSIGLIGCGGLDCGVLEKIVDLVASHSNIQCLVLNENDISDELAPAIGRACSIKSLKKLYLQRELGGQMGSITPKGVEALSKSVAESSLEVLNLHLNDIGPEGGIYLAEALANSTSLKELSVAGAVSPPTGEYVMSSHGWGHFFCHLEGCALHRFDLSANTIEDGDIGSMVESLNTMKSLTNLDLSEVRITASGWVRFFNLLKVSDGVLGRLTELNISCYFGGGQHLNDEGMTAVANALVGNSSLKTLHCGFKDITKEGGWAAFSRTLCNKLSLESLFESNHAFYNLASLHRVDPGTDSLLKLNKEKNKAEVARKKILKYHFSDGRDADKLLELMDVEPGVLPFVIAWAGRDAAGFRFLHRFVLGMPSLFDVDNTKVGEKRKRGL